MLHTPHCILFTHSKGFHNFNWKHDFSPLLVCALWVCNSQCNNHYSFNFTWRDCHRYLERRCIFATVISLLCVGGMGTKWNMFGRWECCCFSKNRRGIKPRDTLGLMTNWFSVMVIVSWKDNGVTVFTAKSDGQWDLILKKKKKKGDGIL